MKPLTVIDVARNLTAKGRDPELVAAYLAHEHERMTPDTPIFDALADPCPPEVIERVLNALKKEARRG